MKYIVAGGRRFSDYAMLRNVLDGLIDEQDVILSGCASGADGLALRFATNFGYACEKYPADWEKHGKAAGPIRNQRMAQEADGLIAFWDGKSHGTKDMIEKAVQAGLELHVYRY